MLHLDRLQRSESQTTDGLRCNRLPTGTSLDGDHVYVSLPLAPGRHLQSTEVNHIIVEVGCRRHIASHDALRPHPSVLPLASLLSAVILDRRRHDLLTTNVWCIASVVADACILASVVGLEAERQFQAIYGACAMSTLCFT
jgi:hypothetical protein